MTPPPTRFLVLALVPFLVAACAKNSQPEPAPTLKPVQPEPKPAPASTDNAEPPSRADIRVQFGIMPGDYEDDKPGVLVGGTTPDSPAEQAGIREGDRLMTWNDQPVPDIRSWMRFLAAGKPGDVVNVGVQRDGKIVPTKVTLRARQD